VRVLLDTNAYAALMRGSSPVAKATRRAERVYLSSIVVGELLYSIGLQVLRCPRKKFHWVAGTVRAMVSVAELATRRTGHNWKHSSSTASSSSFQ